MDRRDFLIAAGVAGALPLASRAVPIAQRKGSSDASGLEAAAREAWIYTLPLIESANARATVLASGTAPGTLFRLRQPTTPATQRVTTPNNDTLNARGWIDLSQGPVRIALPATGDRYVSVALLDMYSNNFAVLGSRTTGPDGGTFTVVGPTNGTAAPGAIRAPTRWIWVLIRLLTSGGDDLQIARAMQDRFVLEAPRWRGTLPTYAKRGDSWDSYFASAAALLRENPPPATDSALLRRIRPLGLEGPFDPQSFTPAQKRQIARGVELAKQQLLSAKDHGPIVAGWSYPRPKLGDFGQDYNYRAQTALNGFAALPVDEAMYMFAIGPRGDMTFDSAQAWQLRLPGNQLPPVDAFWSLTMYEATDDGQFFLTANPIQRYSIGDRTPGLVRNADGGINIVLQRSAPAPAEVVNWLPSPATKPFGVVFRTYRPRAELLNGLYHLPPLERL